MHILISGVFGFLLYCASMGKNLLSFDCVFALIVFKAAFMLNKIVIVFSSIIQV